MYGNCVQELLSVWLVDKLFSEADIERQGVGMLDCYVYSSGTLKLDINLKSKVYPRFVHV